MQSALSRPLMSGQLTFVQKKGAAGMFRSLKSRVTMTITSPCDLVATLLGKSGKLPGPRLGLELGRKPGEILRRKPSSRCSSKIKLRTTLSALAQRRPPRLPPTGRPRLLPPVLYRGLCTLPCPGIHSPPSMFLRPDSSSPSLSSSS